MGITFFEAILLIGILLIVWQLGVKIGQKHPHWWIFKSRSKNDVIDSPIAHSLDALRKLNGKR